MIGRRPEMNSEPTLARQPASKARTIRYQLIWAALFPLILVGLLSALVTSTIARQLASNLAISRSTALAQLSANAMAQDFHPPEIPAAFTQLQLSKSMHGYLVNPAGDIVAQTGIPVSSLSAQDRQDITALARNGYYAASSSNSMLQGVRRLYLMPRSEIVVGVWFLKNP